MPDTFIDLSHRIAPGMPLYPGMPDPKLGAVLTHAQSAERQLYAPGVTFQLATYDLGSNTGTYIDAPFTRYPDGQDMADLPIEKTANLPGLVVNALKEGPIGPEYFEGLELAGKAVLVRTDWAKRWGGPDYFRSGPFLNAAACHFLVEAGAALVGIDCANIDDMTDKLRPAHSILLAAGIPIVEHLRGLDQLPISGFRFFAVPPAIEGGTSFPVRALAIL